MEHKFPFSPNTYSERRKILMQTVGSGKILLIANEESGRNFRDNWYPYRQDSTMLYYCGIPIPGIALVMDCSTGETTLYGDDAGMDMVIWTGPLESMSSFAEKSGIENTAPYAQLSDAVGESTHILPPYRPEHNEKYQSLFGKSKEASTPLIKAVTDQRSIKSDDEVSEINKAVFLSLGMHHEVKKHVRPGIKEYELVAVASKYAYDHNAQFSFPPILTKNGQTLHNHYHGLTIGEHDNVLFDGGIEIESGYCGDITRVTPADGSFKGIQKDLHSIVMKMYDASVEMSKPSVRYIDIHLKASEVLVDNMKTLGWMKGDAKAAVNAGAHALFFQHGLGHLMGLDVHDMENFGEQYVGYDDTLAKSTQFGLKSLRLGKTLQKGFVITIEPGIYVIPSLIDKWQSEKLHTEFINYDEVNKHRDAGGFRFEDDFLITGTGAHKLGS